MANKVNIANIVIVIVSYPTEFNKEKAAMFVCGTVTSPVLHQYGFPGKKVCSL